jgi:K+ transporter
MLASYQRPMTVHHYVDEVVDSFLQFALYYQNNQDGVPLSLLMSIQDIPKQVKSNVYAEVLDFCTTVREKTQKMFNPDQLGVDFYFARNNSATGFWDKPDIYGEYANILETLAKQYQPFIIDNV